jgi:hypothetical protein|tara:strand:- start:1 stop:462 length:462 start_codon:yes stop_codon:yes gene_type:complete
MAKGTWKTASADDPIYKEGLQTSSRSYSREYAKSKASSIEASVEKTQKGFGSAENEDQNLFDKEQLSLSKDDLEKQTTALADLFRRKQAENAMKQQAILEQPNGKLSDPILAYMRKMGFELTQENYLQIAYPEGINSEAKASLPEEFHDLPKK